MNGNKKRTGANGASQQNGNGANEYSNPNLTTFDAILQQAADKMSSDPLHFGEHCSIYVSVTFAKNGWPWPPPGGER